MSARDQCWVGFGIGVLTLVLAAIVQRLFGFGAVYWNYVFPVLGVEWAAIVAVLRKLWKN